MYQIYIAFILRVKKFKENGLFDLKYEDSEMHANTGSDGF
jgi:hypothetical protein